MLYNTDVDFQIKKRLDDFFTKSKLLKYKKGELLIMADDEPSGVFYLTKGRVKQYVISRKGEEIVLNIFKPISFFPMPWAINDTKNIYFFEAVTSVEAYKVAKNQLVDFIRINSDVLYDLVSRIYIGTEGLLQRMIYLMSGNAYPRLVTELLINAKRFGEKNNTTGIMTIKLFEKDIAAETGMSRETVSRDMKILKEKKLVALKNNILTIPDLKRLEEELENY